MSMEVGVLCPFEERETQLMKKALEGLSGSHYLPSFSESLCKILS